jgi:Pyruvate/2-oxoacid:ferredoxin oxidoreductase gamma subunit
MVLPISWELHRHGDGQVTWKRGGHTSAKANIVIFKAIDGSPTSKYQIKGVLGHDPDAAGPGDVLPNSIVEVNIRQVSDMTTLDRTVFNTFLDEIGDLISSSEFQADLNGQALPYESNQP